MTASSKVKERTLALVVSRRDVLLAALISLAGALALSRLTSGGLGVSPDSVQYFSAAGSILEGRGAAVMFGSSPGDLISHWPPGYPYALAAAGAITGEVLSGAVLLNIALLLASCFAATLIVREIAGPGLGSALAPLAVVLSPKALDIHTWMWSEALFLSLVLFHVAAVSVAVRRRSVAALAVASVLAGGAATVRYVGVALLLTLILLVASRPALRSWRHLAATTAPAALLAYLSLTYGGSARSGLIWSLPAQAEWQGIAATVAGWVFPQPGGAGQAATIMVVAAVAAIVMVALFQRVGAASYPAVTVLGLMGVTVASRIVLDAAIVFYWRMFIPEQVLVTVLAVALADRYMRGRAALRAVAAPGVALILAVGMLTSPPGGGGVGYRDAARHPVVLWAAGHDRGVVWSNSADLVYYHTGIPARFLPPTRDPAGVENVRFLEALGGICGEDVVVYELPRYRPSHFRAPSVEQLEGWGFVVVEMVQRGALLAPPAC